MSGEPSPYKPPLTTLPVAFRTLMGAAWGNVVIAAVLMVATLPGRTQGLGLITEPLLRDLRLSRVAYADINLWATLLGSLFCFPAGWLIDRLGLRWVTFSILIALALVVWMMSTLAGAAFLFTLVLLTRGLGQSALSVASITAVGKSFGMRSSWAMGVYAVLLSLLFAVAFVAVGGITLHHGWRTAWSVIAVSLLPVAILVIFFLREPSPSAQTFAVEPITGMSLAEALRTSLFWVFAGATALFGLVSSGFGLFNEAVFAERGFSSETFHTFLAVSTLISLIGQMLCGWLSLRFSMPKLLAVSMFLYAAGLASVPLLKAHWQLWIFAGVFGMSAGFVMVIFFAIWGQAYGRIQLGRIQGAAQMLTVFASALGPLIFAKSHEAHGSYAPLLYVLAPVVFCAGLAAWWTKLPAAKSR